MNPQKQVKNRDEKGRFLPGQSGNPGGRPHGGMKALAHSKTEDAFNKIVQLMERGRSERIQLQAAELILHYGYGRPIQALHYSPLDFFDIMIARIKGALPEEVISKIVEVLQESEQEQIGHGSQMSRLK